VACSGVSSILSALVADVVRDVEVSSTAVAVVQASPTLVSPGMHAYNWDTPCASFFLDTWIADRLVA
jgi:hypothetical protein